jgi:chemotaxis protein CheX
MSTATQSPPPATSALDPKLIVPFINSVRLVFATMVKVPTTVERPHFKTQPAPQYDVSSIIGFSGDIVGSVVVSFQKDAAIQLVSAFAGSPIDPETSDFPDAVCELANMIAGSAKKDLGHNATITVPSVILGHGHQIARLSDVPCLVVPCKTPVGDFAVEVNIKVNKAA